METVTVNAADPIVIKGEVISPYVIVIFTIILFLAFWCWVSYQVYIKPPSDKLLLACVAGKCGTNIHNGEKRCPTHSGDVILIDPEYEVCNSKFTCDDNRTPYALLSDGSTNNNGVCEPQTTCRCLANPQCGSNVTSLFKVTGGNLYSSTPEKERFTFNQIPIEADLGAGNVSFKDPTLDFCGIKTEHLNRLSPGTCMFTDEDHRNPYGAVLTITNCINTNPCVKGYMAFDVDDPHKISFTGIGYDEATQIPVTCIASKPTCGDPLNPTPCNSGDVCPTGYVGYWDKRFGIVRCTEIKYPVVT
jgi:hypothetical protein